MTDHAPKDAHDKKTPRAHTPTTEPSTSTVSDMPLQLTSANALYLQRLVGNKVVQKMAAQGGLLQRELTREPPGRLAEPPALTPQQVQEAITFNNGRFSANSIRTIQDIVGGAQTGVVDADTVQAIVEWQADFRLTPDGQVGMNTLRPICEELIRLGQRNTVIWLVIDGHNMSTNGLDDIRYDASEADNASTSGPIPGNSTVLVGPSGFTQGYPGLVHTIAHELEHVRQRRAGMMVQHTREFLGEAIEIMSRGMIAENLAGFMNDAQRAVARWNLMPPDEQRTHWARFEDVRDRVRRRFNNASAAQQATHQATMDTYTAVVAPPAGP